MTGDPLWINASAGAPSYTANELRQAMALGVMYGGRLLGGRQGVRPGGDQLKVSLAGSTITVTTGVGVVDPALSTPQGPYWVALPADETHTLTAADATNPRKDIIVIRVYDDDEDSSGNRFARSEYLEGTPAPTPSEPSVPAGSFKVALIDVPASGGGNPSVTDQRPWTVAPGGIVPVAADADLAAAVEGRYRDRLDTNVLERDSGAAWETVADPTVFQSWTSWSPTWTTTGTAPSVGNGTLVGAKRLAGKTMDVLVRLTWGSTTSGGTGNWQFDLPAQPAFNVFPLLACVEDASASLDYPGVARLSSSAPGSIQKVVAHTSSGTLGVVSATHPITWTTSDVLIIAGSYPVAA